MTEDKTKEFSSHNAVPAPLTRAEAAQSISHQTQAQPTAQTAIQTPENKTELLTRARAFLQSPQVLHQDIAAKRKFLQEKGLNEADVSALLRDIPAYPPAVPPRTYPQPPPSNLPNLLVGLFRIFSWATGGSAVLLFFYYHFLLPRITQTFLARASLKSHHLSLLRKLTSSLASLKETQAESFAVLPRADPYKEPTGFVQCSTVREILNALGEDNPDYAQIYPITLLRCGIFDFGRGKDASESAPTTEELFRYLEGQIPWLLSEDGLVFERQLWETLSTCPLFTSTPPLTSATARPSRTARIPTRWTFTVPEPTAPSPVVSSLTSLSEALPKPKTTSDLKLIPTTTPRQNTLQALSDFTGYLSTQIYVPFRPIGIGGGSALGNPAEEELRREIRALKGLVLNRRSFMSVIPRAGASSTLRQTP